MSKEVKIGILALQGDVEPHAKMIAACGAIPLEIRRASELSEVRGLLLPGGETTTMTKLLAFTGLHDAIVQAVKKGMAIWGTCAGCILIGKQGNDPRVKSFALLDLDVLRNAYGRQTESFTAPVTLSFDSNPVEGVFIRAPIIHHIGEGIETVGTLGSEPVHLEAGRIWASTFHPELTNDTRLHQRFIKLITQS
jgi:pyridoxal 5'-phosphate synthase pdxT subunit